MPFPVADLRRVITLVVLEVPVPDAVASRSLVKTGKADWLAEPEPVAKRQGIRRPAAVSFVVPCPEPAALRNNLW